MLLGIWASALRKRCAKWVRQSEIDQGLKRGPTTEELAEIRQLHREVADQQRTIEILQGGDAVFREGGRPATAVMVAFIDAYRDRWPVLAMCTAVEMPERSYYAAKARAPSTRSVSDAVRRPHIRRAGEGESNHRCYGARRVHKQLRREGYKIARCTVGPHVCVDAAGLVSTPRSATATGPIEAGIPASIGSVGDSYDCDDPLLLARAV